MWEMKRWSWLSTAYSNEKHVVWSDTMILWFGVQLNYPKIRYISDGFTEKSLILNSNTSNDLYDARANFELMERIVDKPRLILNKSVENKRILLKTYTPVRLMCPISGYLNKQFCKITPLFLHTKYVYIYNSVNNNNSVNTLLWLDSIPL